MGFGAVSSPADKSVLNIVSITIVHLDLGLVDINAKVPVVIQY